MVIAVVALGLGGGLVGCASEGPAPTTRASAGAAVASGGSVASGASSGVPDGSAASTASAAPEASSAPGDGLRYVALGDSYTIGTATHTAAERWPDQLVASLHGGAASLFGRAPTLELVANLGVNGFTSREVIEVELPQLDGLDPAFVSILIGVNDVVQGIPASTYRANAARILDALLERLPADRIVAVATPDYTVTPQGASYGDPVAQAGAIRANNEILRRLAGERGIAWVDIHDLSLRAAQDRSLVADDGLHPSGAQYRLWVERIAPVVASLLGP
jgi:acyl-CoA thioesterase-1